MCPEPSNISGNGGTSASGQPEISQEERQKQIQRFNELSVEQQNAALRYALNGSESPSKNLNPTLDGAGIFGFGNAPTVDHQKLNEVTNQMLDFTMKAGSLPFGMGTGAIESSIGQFFQAIMSCFKFEPLQLPSMPAMPSVQSSSMNSPQASNPVLTNLPAGYTSTSTAGVFSKDGKYYKFNSSNNLVECKADGSAIDAVESETPESKAEGDARTKEEEPKKQTPKKEVKFPTAAEAAAKAGYKFGGYNSYYKENGDKKTWYVYNDKNGKWTEIQDRGQDGSYRIGDDWYNNKGEKSAEIKAARSAGYELDSSHGSHIYTKKNGNKVEYFAYQDGEMKRITILQSNGSYKIGNTTYDSNGEKVGEFKSNRKTSYNPTQRTSVSTVAADYGNGNRILKEDGDSVIDTDARFEIGRGHYNLKVDRGTMIDTTLDYRDITGQREIGQNTSFSFVGTDGYMNPNANLFNNRNAFKKVYFEGDGEFNNCEVQRIVATNGDTTLCVKQKGVYYDLNVLMSTGKKVQVRPGTFISQG